MRAGKMQILVTGATGFVGRHLANRLVDEGKSVVCLVRKSSETEFLKNLGIKLVYGDLLDKNSLKKILRDSKIGVLYHLAGLVYSSSAHNFFKVNVEGTRNLLESLFPQSLEKFIYLSSVAVNGFSRNGTLINETFPCNPFTPYGRSKLIAENLVLNFFNGEKTSAVIIRAPVVYGPDGQPDILTKNFKKILCNKTFVLGDGGNLRSLCYIDNLIDGLLLVERNSKGKNNCYVIADDKAYSFNEIANAIADAYAKNLHIIKLPSCLASISRYALKFCNFLGVYSWTLYSLGTMNIDLGCDNGKAKKELNYKAAIDLQTGIRKTLDFYKNSFA
jgi:nucleoside-diphosphate-sugar epimerase